MCCEITSLSVIVRSKTPVLTLHITERFESRIMHIEACPPRKSRLLTHDITPLLQWAKVRNEGRRRNVLRLSTAKGTPTYIRQSTVVIK